MRDRREWGVINLVLGFENLGHISQLKLLRNQKDMIELKARVSFCLTRLLDES